MINIRDLIVNQGLAKAILGSGGGSDVGNTVKVSTGTFKSTTAEIKVVEHNLGVVPDIVFIYTSTGWTTVDTSYRYLKDMLAFSEAFGTKYEYTTYYGHSEEPGGTATLRYGTKQYVDGTGQYAAINRATETTFTLGNELYRTPPCASTYAWIAIGGLT